MKLATTLACTVAIACAQRAVPPPSLDAASGSPDLQSREAYPAEAVIGAGMAAHELANRKESVVLGCGLAIEGGRASFYSCTAVDACGHQRVELPASSVLAVKTVGRTRPVRTDGTTGDETDVMRITIAADMSTSRGSLSGTTP